MELSWLLTVNIYIYICVSSSEQWDSVVTCFFIDTARNIIVYIEVPVDKNCQSWHKHILFLIHLLFLSTPLFHSYALYRYWCKTPILHASILVALPFTHWCHSVPLLIRPVNFKTHTHTHTLSLFLIHTLLSSLTVLEYTPMNIPRWQAPIAPCYGDALPYHLGMYWGQPIGSWEEERWWKAGESPFSYALWDAMNERSLWYLQRWLVARWAWGRPAQTR